MNTLRNVFAAVLIGLFLPICCFSQEVISLATVTANGGISIDHTGNLLVAHFGPLPPNPSIGKNIYKITPEGNTTLFVEGELNVGSGNAIDSAGFLYQSNFATNTIYKIAPDGTIVDNNFATVAGPVGIAVAPDNSLYVCSCNQNSVKKVSTTGVVTNFASGSVFNCANGITQDEVGNIYTTNFSDGRVTKISPDGTTATLGSTPVGNGHIVYRPVEQVLYVASYSGHQIFRMDLEGNVDLLAGTGAAATINSTNPLEAAFRKPNGINISKDNCSLYISQDDNVIRAILFDDASCVSSIETIEDVPELKIYPNPVTNTLQFVNQGTTQFIAAKFLDSRGKVITKLILNSEENHIDFDVSSFPTGIYTILLQSKSKHFFSYRFVKQG